MKQHRTMINNTIRKHRHKRVKRHFITLLRFCYWHLGPKNVTQTLVLELTNYEASLRSQIKNVDDSS